MFWDSPRFGFAELDSKNTSGNRVEQIAAEPNNQCIRYETAIVVSRLLQRDVATIWTLSATNSK
jgi:hypothetical protein